MRPDRAPLSPLRQWGRVSGRLARSGFWPLALLVVAMQVAGHLLGNFWLLAAASVLLWPLMAAAVRRLHDTGRSGHWLWLLPVPYLGLIPLWLLTRRSSPDRTRFPSIDDTPLPRIGLAAVFALVFLLRWTVVVVQIPAGSMKPGLLPGDVVLGLRAMTQSPAACSPARCPFGAGATPARGDVILFEHGSASYVKRVIGLPGEHIAMVAGLPRIGGTPLAQSPDGLFTEPLTPSGPLRSLPRCAGGAVGLNAPCAKHRWRESLPGGRSYPVLDLGPSALDDLPDRQLAEDALFVLGDNRDNSTDSRLPVTVGGIGPVPARDVIGSARLVLFSVDGPAWQIWKIRPDRLCVPVR